MLIELVTRDGKIFQILKNRRVVSTYHRLDSLFTACKDMEGLVEDMLADQAIPEWFSVEGIHGEFIFVGDGRWVDTVERNSYEGQAGQLDYYILENECLRNAYPVNYLTPTKDACCPTDVDPDDCIYSFMNIEEPNERFESICNHVGTSAIRVC